MRLVLAHNANKPLVPVKYSQIQQLVLRLQAKQKGIANVVIAHAQRRFLRLGWELAQMGSTAASAGLLSERVLRCKACTLVLLWPPASAGTQARD